MFVDGVDVSRLSRRAWLDRPAGGDDIDRFKGSDRAVTGNGSQDMLDIIQSDECTTLSQSLQLFQGGGRFGDRSFLTLDANFAIPMADRDPQSLAYRPQIL